MQEHPLNPERSAVEAALASLAPTTSRIDRDRLMFLAGQAAAAPRRASPATHWLWPASTAVSLLLAATMGALWLNVGPHTGQIAAVKVASPESIADVPPTADALAAHSGLNEYLRLRRLVLEQGVDALPDSDSSSSNERPQPPLRASDVEKWLLETRS